LERRLIVDYLFPIASCLVISLGFVHLFILGGLGSSIHSSPSGTVEQVAWTVSLTLVGLLEVVLLYWLSRSRRA
jgi:hypothetical protein